MAGKRRVAVYSRHRPKVQEKICKWLLPTIFSENEGIATLGMLKSILSESKCEKCFINFKNIEWADPQPLLCMCLILAESTDKREDTIFDLGSSQENRSTPKHRIFLKFFAEQGFLKAFNNFVVSCLSLDFPSPFQSITTVSGFGQVFSIAS